MRVVVTGGRDYGDWQVVYGTLYRIHIATPITLLAHGACYKGGADKIAEDWAKLAEVPYMGIPAKFKTGTLGKAEGLIRNTRMLDLVKPDIVVAFPGETGTADCVAKAVKRNIEVRDFRNGV